MVITAPWSASLFQAKIPSRTNPKVTHAGVRDQPFQIGLSKCQYRPVQDPDHCQYHGDRREGAGGCRKERHYETKQAVRSGFQ
jgi:hypothetical protein